MTQPKSALRRQTDNVAPRSRAPGGSNADNADALSKMINSVDDGGEDGTDGRVASVLLTYGRAPTVSSPAGREHALTAFKRAHPDWITGLVSVSRRGGWQRTWHASRGQLHLTACSLSALAALVRQHERQAGK